MVGRAGLDVSVPVDAQHADAARTSAGRSTDPRRSQTATTASPDNGRFECDMEGARRTGWFLRRGKHFGGQRLRAVRPRAAGARTVSVDAKGSVGMSEISGGHRLLFVRRRRTRRKPVNVELAGVTAINVCALMPVFRNNHSTTSTMRLGPDQRLPPTHAPLLVEKTSRSRSSVWRRHHARAALSNATPTTSVEVAP